MARLIAERRDAIPALAETFRAHGFQGASLSIISRETGLGKGSLYHFFPGGKEEMAEAVLSHVDAWFRRRVFEPLRDGGDPRMAVAAMFAAAAAYFSGGGRVCLVGLFALGDERDRFASAISNYFRDWKDALSGCLVRAGKSDSLARDLAEETMVGIQGAIVLSRSMNDPAVFARALQRLERQIFPDV